MRSCTSNVRVLVLEHSVKSFNDLIDSAQVLLFANLSNDDSSLKLIVIIELGIINLEVGLEEFRLVAEDVGDALCWENLFGADDLGFKL